MAEETNKKEHKEEKSLEKMTVKELKAIAMELPRSVAVHDMKKAELIAFIEEAKGIKDEKPVKPAKPAKQETEKQAVEKTKLSKSEIKGKIRQLKEEKKAAKEENDRGKIDFLRHRINHLKKQTRRMAAA